MSVGGPQALCPASAACCVDAVDGKQLHGFTVTAVSARQSNSYICNDTHYRSLCALELAEAEATRAEHHRMQAAFFIHIPRPAKACASVSAGSTPCATVATVASVAWIVCMQYVCVS